MPLKLHKRGRIWHVAGSIAGQRIRASTGCHTRADAEAWAIREETAILRRHALGPRATYTFAEAALAYMRAGGETRFLARILEHLGPDARLADIDNATAQAIAADLYPDAAPATINRQVIGPISAIVTMAAENGLADPRKFRRMKARGARTRWLDPAEFDRLDAAAAPHLRPILAGLVGSGARVSELLGARATDWHPDTGEIWIPETKNGFPRMVRMPERARDAIAAVAQPAGAIFRTPKGAPYVIRAAGGGQILTAFANARAAAGLGADVTPHVLRHTWATWYYAATRDFGGMLDLGGWRTTSTAERYRKIAPADLGDRLARHGWDFTRLGTDLPAMPRGGLRVVK
jgi:integrase